MSRSIEPPMERRSQRQRASGQSRFLSSPQNHRRSRGYKTVRRPRLRRLGLEIQKVIPGYDLCQIILQLPINTRKGDQTFKQRIEVNNWAIIPKSAQKVLPEIVANDKGSLRNQYIESVYPNVPVMFIFISHSLPHPYPNSLVQRLFW
jgi:hypothetical protein